MRRHYGVPVVLLLGGLAWAAAHWLVHRTVAGPEAVPDRSPMHGAHAESGAGYLATSLSLCLSLALVLAAAAVLGHGSPAARRGRLLWLFGVVPVLGLLGGPIAAADGSLAGLGASLAEIAPLLLVAFVVQLAIAFAAVRVGHGVIVLAQSVARAVVGQRADAPRAEGNAVRRGRSRRAPAASRRLRPGGQRAPPSALPA